MMHQHNEREAKQAAAESSSISGTKMMRDAQAVRVTAWGSVLVVAVVVAMFAQLARVAQLKLDPDPRLAQSVGSPTSSRYELSRRGDLLDRRGRVIATSTVGYRLFVDSRMVRDLSTIAVDLGHILERDPTEIDRIIIPRRDSRYTVIDHLLEDWQAEAVRHARLRGVGLEPRLVRHYPNEALASNIVGKVGFEHSGLAGVEHMFEARLRSERGRLTYLRDARRQALWIDQQGYRPGRIGDTVQLSVDLVIQDIVEHRLHEAVREYNAGGGRAIVLDVETGELLAMCDILSPRKGWEEHTEDPLRHIDPALGRNRCVTDPYEPGSTFKPFIWAVATELGKAQLNEKLPTPGSGAHRTSRGRSIRDAHNFGNATWHEVLTRSLNSGMAIVAERMSERQMQEAVARFGFGRRTGSGLPGETAGIVTTPRSWNHYTQTSVSMGHEIAVTPLQMARAFSVFARDGTMPTIRLLAQHAHDLEYHAIHRILPEPIALTAREALRDVMTEGTGRRAQSDFYQLFGKSGTAQLPKRTGGGYHQNRYVASFIAGAPYIEPRIVVLCVIDDPDKSIGYYGGAIAGPVVRDIAERTLMYMGVAPDQPELHERLAAAE